MPAIQPSKMSRPPCVNRRERRSAEIRERLYRAALQIFAARGYLATTVEDITEAADVGKGTFFNYFPTKEHVLARYGEERIATIERALEKARAGDGPVLPIIKEHLETLARQSSPSPDLFRSIIVAHCSCAPVRAEFQRRLQRGRRMMGGLFELAQERGEVRRDLSAGEMGRLMQVIFMGVTAAWSLNPDSDLVTTTEEVWKLISPTLKNGKFPSASVKKRRAKS